MEHHLLVLHLIVHHLLFAILQVAGHFHLIQSQMVGHFLVRCQTRHNQHFDRLLAAAAVVLPCPVVVFVTLRIFFLHRMRSEGEFEQRYVIVHLRGIVALSNPSGI
jgi:hypothetical protein